MSNIKNEEDLMNMFDDPTDEPEEDIVEEVEEEATEARNTHEQLITRLEAEALEWKDKALRAMAEAENTRRRAVKDRQDAENYGGVRLARDMLSVYDNLDRALAHANEEVRQAAGEFIDGVELTRREILNVFGKHKIVSLEPEIGDKFDPNQHQAMFEAPAPGVPNGAISQVMQPGFQIVDRLLRPAFVGVARNPVEAPKAEETKDAPAADTAPQEE